MLKTRMFILYLCAVLLTALMPATASASAGNPEEHWQPNCKKRSVKCQHGYLDIGIANLRTDTPACFNTNSINPGEHNPWGRGENVVCVRRSNDKVWVKDATKDGRSVVARVFVVERNVHRFWQCRQPWPAVKKNSRRFARCNFNWPEGERYGVTLYEWNEDTNSYEGSSLVFGFDD